MKLIYYVIGTPLKVHPDERFYNFNQLFLGQTWPSIEFDVENLSDLVYLVKVIFNGRRLKIKDSERQIAPGAATSFTAKLSNNYPGRFEENIQIYVAMLNGVKKKIPLFEPFRNIQVVAEIIKPCIEFNCKVIKWQISHDKIELESLPKCKYIVFVSINVPKMIIDQFLLQFV